MSNEEKKKSEQEEIESVRKALQNKSWSEIKSANSWVIFKVIAEFVEGFDKLARIGPCVSIFGSARTKTDDPYYKLAEEVAFKLTQNGFGVITGGGPGIMEAANRGAFRGKATSVGFKIKLPFEDKASTEEYHHITLRQDQFHYRQTTLIENAQAYAAFWGGCGTEFEIYNVITLMQTGYLPRKAIQLYDPDVWKGFDARMREMAEMGTISQDDLKLYRLVDDIDTMYYNLKSQVGV
mgnify:CR=1 FL=1